VSATFALKIDRPVCEVNTPPRRCQCSILGEHPSLIPGLPHRENDDITAWAPFQDRMSLKVGRLVCEELVLEKVAGIDQSPPKPIYS
jgi:hypothetical protein